MSWNFSDDKPIYVQIVDKIKLMIISGVYNCGDKLPSVRDMATEVGVNPNTMQKAFQELERTSVIYSQRTNGRFITDDTDLIEMLRNNIAQNQIKQFYDNMTQMGLSKEEIINAINDYIKELN